MDSDRGIRRVSTYRADSSLLLLGRLRLSTETFDWMAWKNGPGPGALGRVHRHSTGVPVWDEAKKPRTALRRAQGDDQGHLTGGPPEGGAWGSRACPCYISKHAHDAPPRGMPLRASKDLCHLPCTTSEESQGDNQAPDGAPQRRYRLY